MFIIAFIMIIFGFMICGIPSFVSAGTLPGGFGIILFLFGLIIGICGFMILWMRATKVGADKLINTPKPDKILWLYIHKDGVIKPIIVDRATENMMRDPKSGAIVYDMKSYRLGDHSARIVLDSVGHSIDARMAVYASYLKKEKGISTFQALREKAKGDDKVE